jgi:hypothetical protein
MALRGYGQLPGEQSKKPPNEQEQEQAASGWRL